MGRYVSFNTGFEYKFRFGIQPSSDIENFGGEKQTKNFIYWTQKDIEYILETLNEYTLADEFIFPDFNKYEKNISGTYELKFQEKFHNGNFIDHSNKEINELRVCRFELGCLIYHQLLYTDKLEAEYEL